MSSYFIENLDHLLNNPNQQFICPKDKKEQYRLTKELVDYVKNNTITDAEGSNIGSFMKDVSVELRMVIWAEHQFSGNKNLFTLHKHVEELMIKTAVGDVSLEETTVLNYYIYNEGGYKDRRDYFLDPKNGFV